VALPLDATRSLLNGATGLSPRSRGGSGISAARFMPARVLSLSMSYNFVCSDGLTICPFKSTNCMTGETTVHEVQHCMLLNVRFHYRGINATAY
jgi:hypothetical protein